MIAAGGNMMDLRAVHDGPKYLSVNITNIYLYSLCHIISTDFFAIVCPHGWKKGFMRENFWVKVKK
jgi:hypothetical protein